MNEEQKQGFSYFRKCPTCGHIEEIIEQIQPLPQTTPPPTLPQVPQAPIVEVAPPRASRDKIGIFNNGKNLEDGGVEAEWR